MLYSQSLVLNCERLPMDAMYYYAYCGSNSCPQAMSGPIRTVTGGGGGEGGETIPSGKEGGGRTSFINICAYW